MVFDKRKYDQKFQKDNYDRIALNVKKGDKAIIAEFAKNNGFESITDYIKHVVYMDMEKRKDTKIHIENINQNGKGTINIQ